MFSFVENAKVVAIQPPKDKTGAAHTTEWVSMKNYRKATFFIATGTLTSTSNQGVTLYVANDASGTKNKAITSASAACTLDLTKYWVKAASADTWTETTVSSSTFNITKSDDSKMYMLEVDASKLGTFISSSVTYNADYVRLNVATPGAHACLQASWAVLTDPRYASDAPPTAIT